MIKGSLLYLALLSLCVLIVLLIFRRNNIKHNLFIAAMSAIFIKAVYMFINYLVAGEFYMEHNAFELFMLDTPIVLAAATFYFDFFIPGFLSLKKMLVTLISMFSLCLVYFASDSMGLIPSNEKDFLSFGELFSSPNTLGFVLMKIQSLFIIITCISVATTLAIMYPKYNKAIDDNYSTHKGYSLKWTMFVIILAIVCYTASFIIPYESLFSVINRVVLVTTLYLVVTISYYQGQRPSLVEGFWRKKGKDLLPQNIKTAHATANYAANTIDNMLKIEENLIKVLKSDKIHSDSNLTLEKLSVSCCTNRTYMSKYINSVYKCSFYEWINKKRITDIAVPLIHENAKQKSEKKKVRSLQEISEMSGFNSYRVFLKYFLKITGTTPVKFQSALFS